MNLAKQKIQQISYPLLIDGGLSNELEEQGCDLNHKLWTAKVLESDIDAIINAHLNYLTAGAQCIATTSYQASIPGLLEEGYTKEEAKQLILKSVWAAEKARRIFYSESNVTQDILIAASIGPYGAYLADGSEYNGKYGVDNQALRHFHAERIRILDDSAADILAFETFPDYGEAKVIAALTQEISKPAWISFTTKNENEISDGTPIEKCAELFADYPKIFAIGVNCLTPERVSSSIKKLKSKGKDKKIIVYPNSGDVYDPITKSWKTVKGKNSSFVDLIAEWLELGVDIIGGCCRVGPQEIKKMSDYLSRPK